jgi:hypothetical protein
MGHHRSNYTPALLSLFALAAFAATATASDDPSDLANYRVQWASPATIDARSPGFGAFAALTEHYSNLAGRSMEIQELTAGVGVTDSLSFWVGGQRYHVKGHSSGSTFDLNANMYGGKWTFKAPSDNSDTAAAVEFAVVIPGTATGKTTNSSESFFATKDDSVALDLGTRAFQSQLAYTSVKGSANGYANSYAFGLAKDFTIAGPISARLQGQLVDENGTYTSGVHLNNQIRPILYFGAKYDMAKFIRLEGDVTWFPSGVTFAGGDVTALGAFQIYQPGGAAANLRTDNIAMAAVRLVFHGTF